MTDSEANVVARAKLLELTNALLALAWAVQELAVEDERYVESCSLCGCEFADFTTLLHWPDCLAVKARAILAPLLFPEAP